MQNAKHRLSLGDARRKGKSVCGPALMEIPPAGSRLVLQDSIRVPARHSAHGNHLSLLLITHTHFAPGTAADHRSLRSRRPQCGHCSLGPTRQTPRYLPPAPPLNGCIRHAMISAAMRPQAGTLPHLVGICYPVPRHVRPLSEPSRRAESIGANHGDRTCPAPLLLARGSCGTDGPAGCLDRAVR